MDKHGRDAESNIEHRIGEMREGVTDADATGMVADEENIAQVETLSPLLRDRPPLPRARLHDALPEDHPAHATIDRLHAEIEQPTPSRGSIETHVRDLRAFPELEAAVANWWESPATQRFVWNLTQIGL